MRSSLTLSRVPRLGLQNDVKTRINYVVVLENLFNLPAEFAALLDSPGESGRSRSDL